MPGGAPGCGMGCLWSSVIMMESDMACETISPLAVLRVKMTLARG